MSVRPAILISSNLEPAGAEFEDESFSVSNCYTDALHAAGGLPWVLPRLPAEDMVDEAVNRADGVMLTGGDDIQVALHRSRVPGELSAKAGPPDPKRDAQELMLIRSALNQRKPIFAICRGHQILNVALGGTLFVDIASEKPDAIKHNCSAEKDEPVHEIKITRGSLMEQIVGGPGLKVNSCHHQAVRTLASGLVATAVSDDGIVEAIELKAKNPGSNYFVLGVQFHPERLVNLDPVFRRMFEQFVGACSATS